MILRGGWQIKSFMIKWEMCDQSLPIKIRITRISTIRPTPPLGAYPHDRLCGQTGIIPTSASIRIISNIVPNIFYPPIKGDDQS